MCSQLFYLIIMYYTISTIAAECADSISKKCSTGKFCFWMIWHILSLYLIYVTDLMKEASTHRPRFHNFLEKLSSINLKFFVWSLVMYLLYFSFLQFVSPPADIQDSDDKYLIAKYQFCGILGQDLKPFDYVRCGLVTSFTYSQSYFSIYITLIFGIVGITFLMVARIIYNQRKKNKVFTNIEQVFEGMYMDPESVENYYRTAKNVLVNYDLMDVEMRVFRDQFSVDYQYCPIKHYSDCIICVDSFKMDEKVVPFPGCKHNYHYECLKGWIRTKKNCPICKGDFRDNFYKDLCEKMRTEFLRVSEHHD